MPRIGDGVDDKGEGAVQHFTINVALPPVFNHAPVIASQPELAAWRGEAYRYQAAASDPDGDTLTYRLIQPPSGMTINANSGLLSWTPSSSAALGEHTVQIVVEDGKGGTATQIFAITLNAQPNRLPHITSAVSKFYYNVGETFTYNATATDPDAGETLTWSIDQESFDKGFRFNGSTGASRVLSWTAAEPGYHTVTVTVTDSQGASCEQTFTLLALPPEAGMVQNRPPYSINNSSNPGYPQKTRIALGETHVYTFLTADPDNHAILVTVDEATFMAGGRMEGNTLSWTPDAVGEYAITLTATDALGAKVTQGYVLVVEEPSGFAVPEAPWFTSVPDIIHAARGETVRFQLEAADPGGGAVRFELPPGAYPPNVLSIAGSELTVNTNVNIGYSGAIPVRAVNNEGAFYTHFIHVSIFDPASTSRSLFGMVGHAYEFPLPPALAGLTPAVDANWASRGVRVEDGLLVWTPAAAGAYSGSIPFRNAGGAIQGYLALSLTAHNDPSAAAGISAPVITSVPPDPRVESIGGSGIVFEYQVEAYDPQGGALSYSVNAASADGSYISFTNGLLRFNVSNVWQPRTFYLEVVVRNSQGGEARQLAPVTVLPPASNHPPRIINSPGSTTASPLVLEARRGTFNHSFSVSDPDGAFLGDALTYSLDAASLAKGMTLSDATLRWSPQDADAGSHEVTFTAADRFGGVATQTFLLHVVEHSNQPPSITSQPTAFVALGGAYAYAVVASDPNGDPVSLELLEGPEGAWMDGGTLCWTPTAAGKYAFRLAARDSHGGGMRQAWTVIAGHPDRGANQPAGFLNRPESHAVAGREYTWAIEAEDPDGGPVDLVLEDKWLDRGMIIEDGVLRWTPAHPGAYSVAVSALDAHGSGETMTFTIRVLPREALNREPSIASTPSLLAVVGCDYAYQVEASDPDGDTLAYALRNAPLGMEIDRQTGLLTWRPGLPGLDAVEVAVSDGLYTVTRGSRSLLRSTPLRKSSPRPAPSLGWARNTPTRSRPLTPTAMKSCTAWKTLPRAWPLTRPRGIWPGRRSPWARMR